MKRVKKRVSKKSLIIILSIIALISIVGVTYGRYIYNGLRNYYLSAKNFYFNSDKLTENMSRYQIDNWSGIDPVAITINMNSRKNNKLASSDDIEYDIEYECSTNVTCTITKNNGIILATNNTDYFTVTMTPNVSLENGDSIWLNVTTESTSPYEKDLSGLFTIKVGTIGLAYEIIDSVGSPYLDFSITNTLDYYRVLEAFNGYSVDDKIDISTYLALSTENKSKCASAVITLSFSPNVLRLDMTDEAYLRAHSYTTTPISGYSYINSLTFGMDALASKRVRFYKINTNINYTYPYVTSTPIVTFSGS